MKKERGGWGLTYQDVYLMDNLTIEAKAIYGMLCSYAGTGGTAYPSVEFMCSSLQISERRFYTHMNLLIGAGIVEKQICRKNGKRSNNLYVLTPNIHFQPVENESVENESVENLSVENVGSNNNIINNNNTNNNINTICSEPEKSAPSGTGIKIPLADGTYFDVPEDKIPLWKQAYPAVNIDQELKKIIAWCDANPTKRKTRRGVTKFINSWLDRSQNQGRGTNGQQIGVRSGENKQGYIDSYI
ncbi:helix-turn-helix domain-containing protein [Enterocloster sp. HCN-30185]|uniref:helix-turn-helix domain-containing protein n=1 Tax=Enterocloster sp. HCN-30185 TaxID=3134663 RepID=UPI0030C1F813